MQVENTIYHDPYVYGKAIHVRDNNNAYRKSICMWGYPYAYGSLYVYKLFILAHMRMGILYAYGIAHTCMGKNMRTVWNNYIKFYSM